MRKSFFITAFLIAAALGSLLLLAFNQVQLYGEHDRIITRTEKLLFQYSTIREQIIEDIVSGRTHELAGISSSIEELHTDIMGLLDNRLFPAEYKFSFMQQIDLPGLVLLLRRTAAGQIDANLLRLINDETRIISERFMLLERLILSYAKQKLVDFQLVIIGTLALVLFLVTTLMYATYRFLIMPVERMSAQFDDLLSGEREKMPASPGWEEVTGLPEKINRLSGIRLEAEKRAGQCDLLLKCFRQTAARINAVDEPANLYQDACRALLCNRDYILAWVGVEDAAGDGIVPLAADGSSTMTGEECQECFGALLAAQEGRNDPVRQALVTGETVVRLDILAEAPKGPFKNTPMAGGAVYSISLPICRGEKIFGVLTVYTMNDRGLQDDEAAMLRGIADLLAEKIQFFAFRQKLDEERIIKDLIGKKSEIIIFDLDQSGTVLNVITYGNDSLRPDQADRWIGSQIAAIVLPESDPEKVVLKSSLSEAKRYECSTRISGLDGVYEAILDPVDEFPADDVAFLFVLIAPPTRNVLIQPGNFQIAYSAAIGRFAATIAHEITDLSNGIINYAQMLSDEAGAPQNRERTEYLKRIIEGGEKVAAVVEPLLVEQGNVDAADEDEAVQAVFDEVLQLAGHLLHRDGITVEIDVRPPTLRFGKRHLQLVLLTLLDRLCEFVNSRSPREESKKILKFTAVQIREETREMIKVTVVLPGREDDMEAMIVQTDQSTGLWLCKALVKNLGGEMKFSLADKETIAIEFILPG